MCRQLDLTTEKLVSKALKNIDHSPNNNNLSTVLERNSLVVITFRKSHLGESRFTLGSKIQTFSSGIWDCPKGN